MKSIYVGFLAALMVGIVGTSTAMADVGVVDMEKLIKLHPRTASDREILQQYVDDFESERKDMMDTLEKLSDEFDELRKKAEDVTLSAKAQSSTRALAKAKMLELRQTERTLRETAATRQKELTSQELRMRKRVVSEIQDVVEKIAKKKKLALVLDSTGVGVGGYSQVIYNDDKLDITDAVIGEMPSISDED